MEPIQPNPGIQGSQDYVNSLGQMSPGQARHARHMHQSLLAILVISITHWWGNHKRKKMGLPPEPLGRAATWVLWAAIGFFFWWVPFAVYMLLDVYVFQPLHLAPYNAIGVVPVIATIGAGIGLWILHRKRHRAKYQAYYAQKYPQPFRPVPPEPHAFGSDEWISDTGQRIRRNLGR